MHVTIDRGHALLAAGALIVAGATIGAGGFLGGYFLGEARTPPPAPLQTELAEKTYTVDDLEAALTSCQIGGSQ